MEAKAIVLTSFCDEGLPGANNFEIVTKVVQVANLNPGELVLQNLVLSPDPYMRGRMKSNNFSGVKSPVGDVISGFVAGEVIASACDSIPVGTLYGAALPFQTIIRISEDALKKTLFWNLSAYVTKETISYGVGLLGMPGATVYGGLLSVLRPKAGETIFVSGAAGAVGGLVGMLAKNVSGCRVIGSCGGPDKVKFVTESFGFDAALDYKTCATAEDLKKELAKLAPEGIDMYYDNVGGSHFEAAFQSLRKGGRIAVCGGISQYNQDKYAGVHINPLAMIYTEQRIEGFVSTPYLAEGSFLPKMKQWLDEKKVTLVQETTFKGIESWVTAFQSLFTGGNTGKVVIAL